MTDDFEDEGYLTGHLLVAMPGMTDPRFVRTVVYICAHNAEGAMGLVINRLIGSITFPDLLEQLGIESAGLGRDIEVHFGGPVESGRGFVLHSSDYEQDGTLKVSDLMSLTATIDILRDMAVGLGPRQSLMALGYAGWGPGQLDGEMRRGDWRVVPATGAIVFGEASPRHWRNFIPLEGSRWSRLAILTRRVGA